MPIDEEQVPLVARSRAVDRGGAEVGPVTGVYHDDRTGRPEWVTVSVGEGPARFVPLAGAAYARGRLHLDVTAAQVRAAPTVPGGEHLQAAAEVGLYRHYGLSPAGDTDVDPALGTTPRTRGEEGRHSLLPPAER